MEIYIVSRMKFIIINNIPLIKRRVDKVVRRCRLLRGFQPKLSPNNSKTCNSEFFVIKYIA